MNNELEKINVDQSGIYQNGLDKIIFMEYQLKVYECRPLSQ